MATYEHKGRLTYKDEHGDLHRLYPVTKMECIEDFTTGESVLYTPQILTDDQKTQARDNIGVNEEIAETLLSLNLINPVSDEDGSLAEDDGAVLVVRNDDIFLPDVTDEDDGGVLKVVDGKWKVDAIEIPEMPEINYPVTSVDGQTGDVVLDAYETKEDASAKLTEAKEYTDAAVANLVNSAPETLDTLGELAAAFESNDDMVSALDSAITNKADRSELFGGSWNDLTDKPFYEENNQTTIEWDGSTDGRVTFVVSGRTYYKISDNTPTADDIAASTFELSNGESVSVTSELFTGFTNGMAKIGDYLYVIDESTYTGDGDLSIASSDGIYVCVIDGVYPSKFTYGAVTIHQLEEKFIPDTIARVSELPEGFSGSWNDLEDKPFGDTEPVYETVVENVEVKTYPAPEEGEGYIATTVVEYADGDLLVAGNKYKIVINGVEYYSTAKSSLNEAVKINLLQESYELTNEDAFIGNIGIGTESSLNNNEPYCIQYLCPETAQKGRDTANAGLTNYGFGELLLIVDESLSDLTVTLSIYKVVSDAQKIDSKYLHKPDWNQTDDLADDYIKNKPFEKVGNKEVLCFDGTLTFDTGSAFANERPSSPFALNELSVDERFVVVWDDIRYECRGYVRHKNNDGVYIGNIKTYKSDYPFETDYPFAIWAGDSSAYVIEFRLPAAAESDETHTAQIYRVMGDYSFDKDFAKATQGDWEDNDVNSVNYIKNRPFHKELETGYIISTDNRAYSQLDTNLYYAEVEMDYQPIVGETYTILCGAASLGSQSICKTTGSFKYCGNLSLLYGSDDTGENYLIAFDNTLNSSKFGTAVIFCTVAHDSLHTSYVSGPYYNYYPIDVNYLPEEAARKTDILQSDWNQNNARSVDYIKNRTHYLEDNTIWYGGITITDSITVDGNRYYKPSSDYSIPEKSGVIGGTVRIYNNGNYDSVEIAENNVTIGDAAEIYNNEVIIVRDVNFSIDGTSYTAPSVGVYFRYQSSSLYAYDLTYKVPIPLDEKFIPDTIARVSDIPEAFSGSYNDLTDKPTIPEVVTDDHINSLIDTKMNSVVKTVNGVEPDTSGNVEIKTESVLDENGKLLSSVLPDGYPYGEPAEVEILISDCTVANYDVIDAPTLEEGMTYTVVLNGVEYSNLVTKYEEYTEEDEETGEETVIGTSVVITTDDFTINCPDGLDEWEIYLVGIEEAVISVYTVLKPAILVPMSETFIPDTIARVSDLTAPRTEFILNSSTEGSTKKFKITIDDEGVLTATEIVESEA